LFAQQVGSGLEQERQHRQLDAGLFRYRFLRLAEVFKFADIGQVELGDMGHVQPAAVQVARTDLLQTCHVLQLDFAEAAEVDFRDLRDTRAAGAGRRALLSLLLRMTLCTYSCTSSLRMRLRGPLPLMSVSSTPNSRASLRTAGPACTFLPLRVGAPTGGGVDSWGAAARSGLA